MITRLETVILVAGLAVAGGSLFVFGPAAADEPDSAQAADTLAAAALEQNRDLVPIPGGEFVMGADVENDHRPEHSVRVGAFALDRHEVTNAEYLEYCRATDHALPEFWGLEVFRIGEAWPDHPVVCITWADARDYAAWRGCRLPTEAEWEYAARGGLVGAKWPWGDEASPEQANYSPSEGTRPVGSYPPNGYGLYDMAGNVGEWVADWYDPTFYARSVGDSPAGPEQGKYRVVRGGGWHSGSYCNRVYRRLGLLPYWIDFNTGFRCARDADGSDGDAQ